MLIQRQKNQEVRYHILDQQGTSSVHNDGYRMLCKLEEKHRVHPGLGYENEKACNTFVNYIVQAQGELITSVLA